MMRKSRHVTTLLLGSTLALSACGEREQDARLFSDTAACLAAGNPAESCEAAFQEAAGQHALLAPRFATLAACEAEIGTGACEETVQRTSDGTLGNFFVPAMVGFLLAEVLDETGDALKGRKKRYARPLFADRRGYLYAGDAQVGRRGSCNPRDQSCTSGSGGGGWYAATRVAQSTTQDPKPASASSISRKSAGFGATGSRAGGRAAS